MSSAKISFQSFPHKREIFRQWNEDNIFVGAQRMHDDIGKEANYFPPLSERERFLGMRAALNQAFLLIHNSTP